MVIIKQKLSIPTNVTKQNPLCIGSVVWHSLGGTGTLQFIAYISHSFFNGLRKGTATSK